MERPVAQISGSDKIEDVLLKILEIIDKYGPSDEDEGICSNIVAELAFTEAYWKDPYKFKALRYCFMGIACHWPRHSGRYFFPVPGPHSSDPEIAYQNGVFPLWEGEYGDSRRELLKFVIQQICNRRTK